MFEKLWFWLFSCKCCFCKQNVHQLDTVDLGRRGFSCTKCWKEILDNRPVAPLPIPVPKKVKCQCDCQRG